MAKSLYLHLPFCAKKCRYCAFPTHILGSKREKDDFLFAKYLAYLKKEISIILTLFPPISPLKTLYFGGGTPSLFPNEILKELTDFIKQSYHIDKEYEWTIEINPEDLVNREKNQIDIYEEMGFNRFSLGIQTFNPNFLKFLNRSHNCIESQKAIEILHLKKCNYSLDFIIDLPYQNANFIDEETKNLIENIKPPHLSIYSLSIEPESYFSRKFNWKEGVKPLPTDEESHNNFIKLSNFLRNNRYIHYEISSFATNEQFESKHNQMYWSGNEEFYGFGMGAASLLDKKRITRPKTLKKYFEYIDRFETFMSSSLKKIDDFEFKGLLVEREEGLEEFKVILMGSLRTKYGLSWNQIHKYKNEFFDLFSTKKELAKYLEIDEKGVRLKIPDGYLLCDEIVSILYAYFQTKI